MKTRDLLLIGTWTLATATVTVAFLAPRSLDAVDGAAAKTATIASPALEVNGCRLTVQFPTDDRVLGVTNGVTRLKAGDMPGAELVATNTGPAAADFTCTVTLTNASMADLGSRVGPIERDSWHESYPISLQPGESKTIALAPQAKVLAASRGSIRLTVDKQVLVAARYAVDGVVLTNGGSSAASVAVAPPPSAKQAR